MAAPSRDLGAARQAGLDHRHRSAGWLGLCLDLAGARPRPTSQIPFSPFKGGRSESVESGPTPQRIVDCMKYGMGILLMKNGLKRLMIVAMNWPRWVLIGIGFLVGFSGESIAQEPMSPGSYKAPMKYAIQLPPYCFGQYFGRTEPQYWPSRELCGVWTNHFCEGLVSLLKARETIDKKQKITYYGSAKTAIMYTKKGIEPYPRCPWHRDIAQALAEAQAGLMVYGQ